MTEYDEHFDKGVEASRSVFNPVSFLVEHDYEWSQASADQIAGLQESFDVALDGLEEASRLGMAHELSSLQQRSREVAGSLPGINIVRTDELETNIRDLLERVGVIASSQEGGIEDAVGELARQSAEVYGYLNEYEASIRGFAETPGDVAENVAYTLAVIAGIKSELERLKLVDLATLQQSTEVFRQREADFPLLGSYTRLEQQLKGLIVLKGLIGFSTLEKLLEMFPKAKRYTQEAIDELVYDNDPVDVIGSEGSRHELP